MLRQTNDVRFFFCGFLCELNRVEDRFFNRGLDWFDLHGCGSDYLLRHRRDSPSLFSHLLDRDVHELARNFSLLSERNVHYFLSVIYNIQFVCICLESYALVSYVIRRYQVRVLLVNYLEGFINQFFIGHVMFSFECNQECLRTDFADLSQYLGSCAKFESDLRFFAGLDFLWSDSHGLVVGGGACSKKQVGCIVVEFSKNCREKLAGALDSNRLNACGGIYGSGTQYQRRVRAA